MTKAVEMLNITKIYDSVISNQNVSIEVYQDEILGLIGENGAGKTTIMNILYGMRTKDDGCIKFFGEEVDIPTPNAAIKLGIGMVHQHFMLMPNLSVLQNIILGKTPCKNGFIDEKKARNSILSVANEYNLAVDLDKKIYQLSVGEKQRVEIVKALYRNVKVLILDEPTAVLTPPEIEKLLELLNKLKKQGCAIIFITHKLKEVMTITDRISVMRKGVVVRNLLTKDANTDILSELIVGKKVDLNIPRGKYKPGDTLLKVENLKVLNQRGLKAVKGVSFEIKAGEILGVAGVEGNGQTELIEALTGMTKPVGGKILFLNKNITLTSVRERREFGMSHIPEDRLKMGGAKNCSIKENLILNAYYRKDYYKYGFINNKKLFDLSESLCKLFGVKTPNSSYNLGSLSGGNMQKVVVAREMNADPKVLIAAQPTRGIDIGAIQEIHKRIIGARDGGKGILLISAELDEILSLSDRILVMYEGEISAVLSRDEADEKTMAMYMTGAKKMEVQNGV